MPANVSITGTDDDAITLDMVGQYTFCPRRFHLMYVEGRWDDNAYTVEGRHVHRRVDQLDHLLPELEAAGLADSPSVKKTKKEKDCIAGGRRLIRTNRPGCPPRTAR